MKIWWKNLKDPCGKEEHKFVFDCKVPILFYNDSLRNSGYVRSWIEKRNILSIKFKGF